jgi:hypothetical protein
MRNNQPKPFALVLMPFSEKFRDIYEVGIKLACRDAGVTCERIDEQIFSENILERIYNEIRKADIIISEMTGRNANVFYETGYAHGQGKQVVLLTQEADDLPFDLRPYPHIVYKGSIHTLKNELERRMRWHVERLTGMVGTDSLENDLVEIQWPNDMKPLFSVR